MLAEIFMLRMEAASRTLGARGGSDNKRFVPLAGASMGPRARTNRRADAVAPEPLAPGRSGVAAFSATSATLS